VAVDTKITYPSLVTQNTWNMVIFAASKNMALDVVAFKSN
jgi:hypothetical protein